MKAYSEPITDIGDIEYVRSTFARLDEVARQHQCTLEDIRRRIEAGELAHPTYALADGTAYVPRSYLEEACSFEEFSERVRRAAADRNMLLSSAQVQDEWNAYLSGGYGLCLRVPSPENIVEKTWLMAQIDRLLADARPNDVGWKLALESLVDALDDLEAAFTQFDRQKYGPVTRQRYIEDIRRAYGFPTRHNKALA